MRSRTACWWLTMLLVAVAAHHPLPAAALDYPLLGGERARFKSGTREARGLVRFLGDVALDQMPDPRCPAESAVRLTAGAEGPREFPLACGGWRPTRGGYRYDADDGDVTRIRWTGRRLEIRLGGAGAAAVHGPLQHLEIGVRVGAQQVCGRFEQFSRNDGESVRAPGPTRPCLTGRPNFVIVVLDDARFDQLDAMPVFQTRIAGEGRTFDNAFTPNAVCCPSRASLLTGRYSVRHGTYQIAGAIGGAPTFRLSGADQQTIAVALRAAGYRTGLFGKYLNAYGAERGRGPNGTFYVPPGWDRWWAMASEHYGGLRGADYEIVHESGATTVFADHSSDAEYSTDLSAQMLRQFVGESRAAGRPFLAVWTPVAPHGELPGLVPAPAERHFGLFADLAPWRPASWKEADTSDKPRWVRRLQRQSTTFLPAITDQFRIRQYEALLAVDEQLGLLLDHLEALGVGDDTLVLVTSDNGLGWGEHHLWMLKGCPYEECQRVPFTVRFPRRLTPLASSHPMPVCNIDVAPTLADLAGVALPRQPDGQSLVPWLADPAPPPNRADYLLEHWRLSRGDGLTYSGQPSDGDRLRIYRGATRAVPRDAVVFEFDTGDGIAADAVAVPIGADADATFASLAALAAPHLDQVRVVARTDIRRVIFIPDAPDAYTGIYLWEEVDSQQVMAPDEQVPDSFGVRDVAGGFTWVEYETGERELYDLSADPGQLDNRADDPAYAGVRATLAARLQSLLAEVLARP